MFLAHRFKATGARGADPGRNRELQLSPILAGDGRETGLHRAAGGVAGPIPPGKIARKCRFIGCATGLQKLFQVKNHSPPRKDRLPSISDAGRFVNSKFKAGAKKLAPARNAKQSQRFTGISARRRAERPHPRKWSRSRSHWRQWRPPWPGTRPGRPGRGRTPSKSHRYTAR